MYNINYKIDNFCDIGSKIKLLYIKIPFITPN